MALDTDCVESHICLRYSVAMIVRTGGLGEVLLCPVERLEQLGDSLLVCVLCATVPLVQRRILSTLLLTLRSRFCRHLQRVSISSAC